MKNENEMMVTVDGQEYVMVGQPQISNDGRTFETGAHAVGADPEDNTMVTIKWDIIAKDRDADMESEDERYMYDDQQEACDWDDAYIY